MPANIKVFLIDLLKTFKQKKARITTSLFSNLKYNMKYTFFTLLSIHLTHFPMLLDRLIHLPILETP